MTSPPRKLKLKYILNKEEEQNREEERRRRRNRHESGSSSKSAISPGQADAHRKGKSPKSSRAVNVEPEELDLDLARSEGHPGGPSGAGSNPEGLRSYECYICGKYFLEKGNLNKHITSVHYKEKTKICPEPGCGKKFSFRDGLVRHIAHVHENQRQFICELCDKSFKQASHLTKHQRSIHKID